MWCCRRCRREPNIYGECMITPVKKVVWSTTVPEGCILREKLTLVTEHEDRVLYKVWYPGPKTELTYDESVKVFESRTRRPLIWIGGDGKNMIDQVEKYVVPGNKITLELLKIIDPDIKWKYCSQTLDILDFPSEGFIINDPVIQTNQKEE